MAEYVLDPGHWPELPPRHRAFLDRALPMFQADARLVGLAAGGSFITGELDEHSDLDLVVVSLPGASHDVLREGVDIAQRLGPLLAAFPGDHVGEARLLICLYGPPLLHVDLKFLSTDELRHRVEDPTILWDRHGALRSALSTAKAEYPQPRVQWIEDRFWVWVHYIAVKIARGELFEAIDGLGFLRARVLGPLVLFQAGVQPQRGAPRRTERAGACSAAPIDLGSPRSRVLSERARGHGRALHGSARAARFPDPGS